MPVFYVSPNLFEQFAKNQKLFRIIEKEIVRKKKIGGDAKGGAKLKGLLTWVTNNEFEAGIGGYAGFEKEEKSKEITSDFDFVQEFVKSKGKVSMLDIAQYRSDRTTGAVYSFAMKFRLDRVVNSDEGTNSIFVSSVSDGVRVSGFTSSKNWVAESLLNNFLWSCKTDRSFSFFMSGICLPISANTADPLKVQFLALFSDDA